MDSARPGRRGQCHVLTHSTRPLEAPLNTLLSFWPNVLGERPSRHAIPRGVRYHSSPCLTSDGTHYDRSQGCAFLQTLDDKGNGDGGNLDSPTGSTVQVQQVALDLSGTDARLTRQPRSTRWPNRARSSHDLPSKSPRRENGARRCRVTTASSKPRDPENAD